MAYAHIAFSVSAKKISFRFFHLSGTKCQNPMKFQNEKANTERTPKFSKIIQLSMSDVANIPPDELFSVKFSL